MQSVTLPVSDVTPAMKPIKRLDVHTSVASLLRRRIEAMAVDDDHMVCCKDTHPFAQAAHDAFYDHCPLTITPDDIWFCIAQGFSHHVNLNAEALRDHFVRHQGKLKLNVVRDDFILGRPNPWPEVFTAFSAQIAGHVGRPLHDLVVADFSTTTAFHRAATEVALMDVFQPYFEYEMSAGCGIPAINLKGAPDDWRDIRRRAAALRPYGLEYWVDVLLPVLDQIEASSRGHHDRAFWASFFHYASGSGGTAMTGWIHVLFPYLEERHEGKLVPNEHLPTWSSEHRDLINGKDEWLSGPTILEIPSGISSAPVRVIDGRTDEKHDMRFVAGMFGVSQDPASLALSTSFGWAVAYDEIVKTESNARWRMVGRPKLE